MTSQFEGMYVADGQGNPKELTLESALAIAKVITEPVQIIVTEDPDKYYVKIGGPNANR